MFSAQDRTYIRHFLGFSAVFKQADLRAETAITAIQSVADGGSQPDSSSENFIKGLIYGTNAVTATLPTPGPTAQNVTFTQPATQGLLAIEQKFQMLWDIAFVQEADQRDAVIDAARGVAVLRKEGRRLVSHLARMLATSPRADVFAGTEPNPRGDTFYDLPDGSGCNYQW